MPNFPKDPIATPILYSLGTQNFQLELLQLQKLVDFG